MKAFKNVSVYAEGKGVVKSSVYFDEKIEKIGGCVKGAEVIELPEGATVLPGFIDEHIHGAAGEAIAALVSLGYTNAEAAAVIAKLPQDLPVEEMIKRALKSLAMGR